MISSRFINTNFSICAAVLVSSSGFNRGSNNIIIDIECHLRAKTDVQLAERRTKVVDTIATILDDYKKK